jgi:hypothetical protein
MKNIQFIQHHHQSKTNSLKGETGYKSYDLEVGKLDDILLNLRANILKKITIKTLGEEHILETKVDYENFNFDTSILKSKISNFLTFCLLMSLYCYLLYNYYNYFQLIRSLHHINDHFKDECTHAEYLEDSKQNSFHWGYHKYVEYQNKIIKYGLDRFENLISSYLDKSYLEIPNKEKLDKIKTISNKDELTLQLYYFKRNMQNNFIWTSIIYPIVF